MKISISIYSKHHLLSSSISHFITSHRKDVEVDAVDSLSGVSPELDENILILNLVCHSESEVTEILDELCTFLSDPKIILLSNNRELNFIRKIFDRGVKAYLGLHSTADEFLQAIDKVLEGEVFINEAAKKTIIENVLIKKDQVSDSIENPVESLTKREYEILICIGQGISTKKIAELLFISTYTVDTHRRNIMQKLNVNSSMQLLKYIYEHKLVDSY